MKQLLFLLVIALFSPVRLWASITGASTAPAWATATPQLSFVGDQSQCGVVKLTFTIIGHSNAQLINAGSTIPVSNGSQVTVSYNSTGRAQPILIGTNNSTGRVGGFSLGFTSPTSCQAAKTAASAAPVATSVTKVQEQTAATPQLSFVGDQSQCGVVKLTFTIIGHSNAQLINAGPTIPVSNGSQVTVSYDGSGRVQPVLIGTNNSTGRVGGFSLGFTSPASCSAARQSNATTTLYPNPASNQVTIKLHTASRMAKEATRTAASPTVVRLYNAYGKLCLEQRATNGQDALSVNTASLPEGLYVVSVSGPNGEHIRQHLKIER